MDPCSIGSKQKIYFLDGTLHALNEQMTRSVLLKCGTQDGKTQARKREELLLGGCSTVFFADVRNGESLSHCL